MKQTAQEILDTLLGYLGFIVEIEEQERDGHPVLQIYTREAERLIGHREQTLDDLQYLVNRILQAQDRDAPRVIVDVEHHRLIRDDLFIQKIRQMAESVRNTGRPLQTEPLNSYDRRLVHNAFLNDPRITTWSPPDDSRIKRITLKPRATAGEAPSDA
ncbi:MAG TPA: R3H domain-containing nucleic acid-binding protein [Chthoniobacterales bacterium]